MTPSVALVVATGPTLLEFPVAQFYGKVFAIGVNDAYRKCPWLDVLYASDYDWWAAHAKSVSGLPARKIGIRVPGFDTHPFVEYHAFLGRRGFSGEWGKLWSGHNSGYPALQLAFQIGYRNVLLAGFDMGATGNDHFFGRHESGLDNGHDFPLFVRDFDDVPGSMRVRLVTSPSALSGRFETVSVEDAINELSAASSIR